MHELAELEIVYCSVVLVLSYAIRGSAGFGGVTVPLLALAPSHCSSTGPAGCAVSAV